MANPLFLFLALCIISVLIFYAYKVTSSLIYFVEEKKKESKNTETAMNDIIKKMKDQIKYLNMQRNANNKKK